MKQVSFVILHYGSAEVTDRCVYSILRMEAQDRIRIVIVDNETRKREEDRRKFRERYQNCEAVTVLTNQENGSFSHGNNLGYRYAREKQKASCILLLNNDIEFTQKDFLTRLEHSIETNPCHVLGPDIIRRSTGEHQNPMDSRLRTREEAEATIRKNRLALKAYPLLYPLLYWNNQRTEKRKTTERLSREDYYHEKHTGIVPFGACLIFTPEFVEREEEALTPETDFYYEEYILACRCEKKGYETGYDPAMKVYHESGEATGRRFGSEYGRLRFMMERVAGACEIYKNMC